MNASVGARLLVFASVVMVLLLPLAGWVIAQAFERSALEGLQARVEAYAGALAGLVEVNDRREVVLSRSPQELSFEQVYSGWYWQLHHRDRVLLTSRSLWDSSLPLQPSAGEPRRELRLRGPRDEALTAISLQLNLPRLTEPVELVVSAPLEEIRPEISAFNRVLVVSLGSLGAMLLVIFALQIRWGLAPLRRMKRELQAVRSGARDRLDPRLPSDLRDVAEVMNQVLAHQEALIQRARSTAGNLAHALKTPLATLRLRLQSNAPDVDGMQRDLRQIRDIVEHHLMRAAAAGRAAGRHQRTDLRGAIEPVIDAVRGMLLRGRPVRIELHFEGHADVMMDPQDLQELVGNLLENAAKWARERVDLYVDVRPYQVGLRVDDDGPGIPEAERQRAVARGVRLDVQSVGSGLGLAIVRDIAELYAIEFRLEQSATGGLSAQVTLPRQGAEASGAMAVLRA